MSCYTRLLHLPATTIPASPASTISSYNRFLAFSMTAPPPEKASPAATDRQDCAGLRSRPACLPAVAYVNSIRLADPRCCPKDWGYEDSVPSRHKKSSREGCFFVRAKGLEPIRTKAPDPKSGLATNYNTLAKPFGRLITGARHRKKPLEAVSTCIRKEYKCKNYLSFLQICKL